jgi:hypothetical protein
MKIFDDTDHLPMSVRDADSYQVTERIRRPVEPQLAGAGFVDQELTDRIGRKKISSRYDLQTVQRHIACIAHLQGRIDLSIGCSLILDAGARVPFGRRRFHMPAYHLHPGYRPELLCQDGASVERAVKPRPQYDDGVPIEPQIRVQHKMDLSPDDQCTDNKDQRDGKLEHDQS